MQSPKPWELWSAWFEYEDKRGGKDRPVLVLFQDDTFIICAEITKHESRPIWGEHEIIRWQSAGLQIPSTVRLTQTRNLKEEDFRLKIGELQPVDIEMIKEMLE